MYDLIFIGGGPAGLTAAVYAIRKRLNVLLVSKDLGAEPLATAAPLSAEQNAQYDAQVARWERGSWFRLHDGQQTVRVRLRWISPLRTLYMFSSGEQDKGARVLSPEAIKSYLQQGWLEPLEDEPLITRVVERVVDELEHSPKRADALVEKIRATEAPKPH